MRIKLLGIVVFGLVIITGCQAEKSADVCDGVTCEGNQVCNATSGVCEAPARECLEATDCGDRELCSGGKCVSQCDVITCDANAGMTCDPASGTCKGGLPCPADGCGDGQLCENDICVAGRLQECGNSVMCASGLNCQAGASSKQCVAPCESSGDCGGLERCYLNPPGILAGLKNHCFINLCEPSPRDPFGIFQAAEFLDPCNAAGEGDGLCMGPMNNDGIGICLFQGAIAAGETCDADAIQSDGADGFCDGGMCVPNLNRCMPPCVLFDPDHACPDTFACGPAFVTDDAPTGLCFSVGDSAPGLGEECTREPSPLSCRDGMLCTPGPDADDSSGICRTICDSAALAGDPGACTVEGDVCISAEPEPGEDPSRIGACAAGSTSGN